MRPWRSLEECGSKTAPGHSTFKAAGALFNENTLERREFLQLLTASLSLAGVAGCSRPPPETIVPYVHAPAQLARGNPLYFTTVTSQSGSAIGLLVRSDFGRPTKVEGNLAHAGSLGATDIFAQAAVLDLCDPDRSQAVLHRGQPGTWDEFLAEMGTRIRSLAGRAPPGTGLRVLTQSTPPVAARVAH